MNTLEYDVPLSGAELNTMTKSELERWGQKDDPTEATAIFPPSEPMGWPAKDYKSATITYYDESGHTVNRATPFGGVSTSEYNEDSEVVRTLSADNRAAALNEGSKAAETAELLDTKSTYSKEGNELLETLGPQHLVKLASGTSKQARNHVRYFYDEGAPEGERYALVTKTVDGAEYEGKETELRTTKTSYSGQKDLGWLLRKPTTVTTDPANAFQGSFESTFGTKGSANGEFNAPRGVAAASNGDIYVVDTLNSRVEEFSPSGTYITKFPATAKEGSGNGEFKDPEGIAVAPNGDVYVADTGNNRVEVFNSEGKYLSQLGQAGSEREKLTEPTGVAVAASGDVYVLDRSLTTGQEEGLVREYNEAGSEIRAFGEQSKGSECESDTFYYAHGIAVAPSGDVYVADPECDTITEFSATGEDVDRFGSYGHGNGDLEGPEGVVVGATGKVYVADTKNNRVEEFTENGKYRSQFGQEGTENGDLKAPYGLVVAASGEVTVADTGNDRITKWGGFSTGLNLIHTTIYEASTGKVLETRAPAAGEGTEEGKSGYAFNAGFGSEGTSNGQFMENEGVGVAPDGAVYVSDAKADRVQEFSSSGEYITQWGSSGSGSGEFSKPQGVAVAADGDVYVADYGNNRVEEFSAAGTYITQWGSAGSGNGEFEGPAGIGIAPSGDIYISDQRNARIEEFTSSGEYITQFGKSGHENGQLSGPRGVAVASDGDVYVVDAGNYRVEEFSSSGTFILKFGSYEGLGTIQLSNPFGIAIASDGNLFITDAYNDHVVETSASGGELGVLGQEGGSGGQLESPRGVAIASSGRLYVADTGNKRVEIWAPPASANVNQTIYYTAASNSTYPTCGEHPQWAALPCQSQPAAQPGTTGLPELPVVTDTYNLWDEPETITEKFGTTTRTKKLTYDSAGRLTTSEETSTIDTALPKVTDKYSSETGAMIEQSTTIGETTRTIKSVYSTLGRLSEYTDAGGNTTQYVYAGPANDDQLEEMDYGSKKGSQVYSYAPNTDALTKLLDVGPEGSPGAGSFTASYDVEGKMTAETYPNGMSAKDTYNADNEATGIEYDKTTDCTEKCVWFSETMIPSVHGEARSRTTTLAKEEYTYDNAGRLIQVNETPTGKGCKTRIYSYNEDSDRTSETTRESSTSTCATSGGKTESHNYDDADRLIDTGVQYETVGNQTKLPAADAGEHEITASFYVDNQVASERQNSETTKYTYDPSGRTEDTTSEGTTTANVLDHYASPSEAISWTSEEEGKKWTRDIPGIDGSLAAVENSGEPAVLQLHDLQGNIVATAAISETETKPLTSYNSTEFGVQVNGTPPTKYSWLGASGLTTEPASAATASGGTSYVPQLGAPLQTQPIAPPGAFGNGTSPAGIVTAVYTVGGLLKNIAVEHEAALEAAARQQAEEQAELARDAECTGSCAATPEPGEGGAEEGVDPTNSVVLFTPAEAIADGQVLCNCSVVHGIGTVIEGIAHKIGIAGIGEVIEEILNGGYAESIGKELLTCGEYTESNSANRCALEYHSWSLLGVNTWLPTKSPLSVGACYYYKKSYRGEKRGLHCKDGQYYKPGSY